MTFSQAANERDLIMIRDVNIPECSWLPEVLSKGELVMSYNGHCYGCISPNGTPIKFKHDGPFYEVPADSVRKR